MIAALLSGLWPYIAGLVIGVLAYFGALSRGKRIERNRRTNDRLKAMQKKNALEKDVSNADRNSIIDINTRH